MRGKGPAMFQKNFDRWDARKKIVDGRNDPPFCHPREIWWCVLGVNVGFEQDGSGKEYYRPVLILKVFSARTCLAIPLTGSSSAHPLRPRVGVVGGKNARALLSQLKVIDTKRLGRKLETLDHFAFEVIRKAARDML